MALIGGVVITHGRLAIELVEATKIIVGDVNHITAVSIDWHVEVDEAHKAIEESLKRVDQGRGVLILTDMFGGTPTNLAMTFSQPGSVEILTGVNLPMVIKMAGQQQDEVLGELARRVRDQGQK